MSYLARARSAFNTAWIRADQARVAASKAANKAAKLMEIANAASDARDIAERLTRLRDEYAQEFPAQPRREPRYVALKY